MKVHCAWKKFKNVAENYKFLKKILNEKLPNLIQIYRISVPPWDAWILKIWAFELNFFGKILEKHFAISWSEYAINTKKYWQYYGHFIIDNSI